MSVSLSLNLPINWTDTPKFFNANEMYIFLEGASSNFFLNLLNYYYQGSVSYDNLKNSAFFRYKNTHFYFNSVYCMTFYGGLTMEHAVGPHDQVSTTWSWIPRLIRCLLWMGMTWEVINTHHGQPHVCSGPFWLKCDLMMNGIPIPDKGQLNTDFLETRVFFCGELVPEECRAKVTKKVS